MADKLNRGRKPLYSNGSKTIRVPADLIPQIQVLIAQYTAEQYAARARELSRAIAAPKVITRVSAAAEPAAEEINYDAWSEEDRRNFMRLPSIDLNRLRAQFGSYQAALDAGYRAKQVNGKWVLV